ncbi:autoinducer binding domain-containing protein [Candidatus Nitrospira bockiana]
MDKPRMRFPVKAFEDFSKRELHLFLEVLHHALGAETDEDVKRVLHVASKLVPGEHVIAGLVHVDPRTGRHRFSKLLNVSYHEQWVQRYLSCHYADVDPVLLSHVKRFGLQVWSNSFKTAASAKAKAFVAEAESFGLANGVTIGAFDQRRSVGTFFSFAGGTRADNGRYAQALECLGHYLHHTLMRTADLSAVPSASLSSREMSVLNWMKTGKTNWEISRILGVSERTVRFHVESIFTKLDVSSRTQAVATALEQGMLRAS